MLNKPINCRILLVVTIWAALSYALIAALVNLRLFQDLLSAPITFDALTATLSRAEGGLGPWLLSMVCVCLIVAACVTGGAHEGATGWTSDDEDDVSGGCSWRDTSDDEFRINPATGLPMVGSLDIAGHPFGCCD